MLDRLDRERAAAHGRLVERYALAGDWSRMRTIERHWVVFSEQYHGRDRTEICQTEMDARLFERYRWEVGQRNTSRA